jgi:type IV pilus assembly protein PilX
MSKQVNMITRNHRVLSRQRGSALIIALVFLLVMTLIGTTAMQGTSQQENMAGNVRDRNLAFQAAEAALRAGERDAVNNINPLIAVQAQNTGDSWVTYLQPSTPPPNRQNPSYFLNNNQAPPPAGSALALTQVNQQPSYVIENMNNTDVACLSDVTLNCFRITAVGVGGTLNAIAILQSNYYQ